MTYDDLQEALRVLGLSGRSSLREIKTRHRELVKRHHPDTGNIDGQETIRKVNAAYRLVLDYVAEYRFSFAEEEFYEQNPEERLRRQFMGDPLWGNGYPPCPSINTFKSFLEKRYGVKVVVGTHPIPKKYLDIHLQLGTWEDPQWTPLIAPTMCDEATRSLYD